MRVRDIIEGLWTLDKPERWIGLAEVEARLPDPTFLKTFVDVWANCETNDRHIPLIDGLIARRGVTAARVMPRLDRDDRAFHAALPDRFTVYRGATSEAPYTDYSWTTDIAVARRFAARCSRATPALITGTVAKADVWFATNQRDEHEIAVHHDRVTGKAMKRIGRYKRDSGVEVYMAVQSGDLYSQLNPEILTTRYLSGVLFGHDFRASYIALVEHLESLGFATAARQRRQAFAAIDWPELIAKGEAVKAKMAGQIAAA